MVELSTQDRTSLINILIHIPIFQTERGREALLELANLQQLRPHLDLSGETVIAVPLTIRFLCSYGKLNPEQEALGRFLGAVTDYVGVEQRSFLEYLIVKYKLMTPVAERPLMNDWPNTIADNTFLEKIIGENTLRPIAFLQRGLNSSRSVAYIEATTQSQKWSGTGFMISLNLLLTNNHVLPKQDLLPGVIFRFNYQDDINGNSEPTKDFVAVPEGRFYTNQDLDFTIVELGGNPGSKDEFGCLPLRPVTPSSESRINIIQHPNGLPKQIAMQNNFVKYANSQRIQYITSTKPGSSGSPVFDDEWKVIGLHHAGGMLPEETGGPLYFRNEAISTQAILGDDKIPKDFRDQITVL